MKLIVFSDLHAHAFKSFATYSEGVNSRLAEIINRLETILRLGREEREDVLFIFAGDFFHERRRLDVVALDMAKDVIRNNINGDFLACSGTHDMTYSGYSSLTAFKDIGQSPRNIIVDGEIVYEERGIHYRFVMVPHWSDYGKMMGEIRNKSCSDRTQVNILITHGDYVGARIGNYTFENGLNLNEISELYDFSIIGHIHNPEVNFPKHNILIPGQAIPHHFGDTQCGFAWRIDLPRFSRDVVTNLVDISSRIEFPHPMFKTIDLGPEWSGSIEGLSLEDYYKFISPTEFYGPNPPGLRYVLVHSEREPQQEEGEIRNEDVLTSSPRELLSLYIDHDFEETLAPWSRGEIKEIGNLIIDGVDKQVVFDTIEELAERHES